MTALLIIAVLVGGFLRLNNLAARPIHYDEGVHAFFVWKFIRDGVYYYGPSSHGPLIYYISLPAFAVNPSVVAGRITIALASLLLIIGTYLYRGLISVRAIAVIMVIFTIHPFILRSSRFFRSDILTATGLFIAVALYLKWIKETRDEAGTAFGIVLALTFATKEISYLSFGFILIPLALVWHFDARFSGRSLVQAARSYFPTSRIRISLTVFVGAYVLLFIGFPPYPPQSVLAPFAAIYYWSSHVSGGSADPLYYLQPVITNAPLVFAACLIACIRTFVDSSTDWYRWIFIGWAGITGAFLSLLSDQQPWMIVHVFVPIAFLAGVGVDDLVEIINLEVPDVSRAITPIFILLIVSSSVIGGIPNIVEGTSGYDSGPDLEEGYETAVMLSEQTNRPILLLGQGENVKMPWPAHWYLRKTPFTHNRTLPSPNEELTFTEYEMRYHRDTIAGHQIPFMTKSWQEKRTVTTDSYLIVSPFTLPNQTLIKDTGELYIYESK